MFLGTVYMFAILLYKLRAYYAGVFSIIIEFLLIKLVV